MPSEPTLTLIQDLEDEAAFLASSEGSEYRARYNRLRAAATRIRSLLDHDAKGPPTLVRELLAFVNGAGPLPATPPATCGTCGGSGSIGNRADHGNGVWFEVACPACRPLLEVAHDHP